MMYIVLCCSADVDECVENLDNCDENADCTDVEDGFMCSCIEGYSGNGTVCDSKCCGHVGV